jgi:hypothetical protein
MKLAKKLLTPVLALSSLFCGVAFAQQKQDLPDAPLPQPGVAQSQPISFRDAAKIGLFTPYHPDYFSPRFKSAAAPKSDNQFPMLDGKLGRIAGYVDQHSSESQYPFDFSMEYKVTNRLSIQGGTLQNLRAHSGKDLADRMTMRMMTGLPDSQTISLRNMLGDAPPTSGLHQGNDGYGAGVKFYFGHKK